MCPIFNGCGDTAVCWRLTWRAYVDFLENVLPLLLEEVPLAERMRMVTFSGHQGPKTLLLYPYLCGEG
jgi:hypothetical protein